MLHSKAAIPNAPTEKGRQDVTTDLQFADGKVIVAGLSNEEFASQLRVLAFPFAAVDKGTSVEIYHGAHGKLETNAPVRTLAVFDIGGQAQRAGGLHLHAAGEVSALGSQAGHPRSRARPWPSWAIATARST